MKWAGVRDLVNVIEQLIAFLWMVILRPVLLWVCMEKLQNSDSSTQSFSVIEHL